jgi:3-methyladenine DNA glycosylase AlkD
MIAGERQDLKHAGPSGRGTMPTAKDILKDLKAKGSEKTRTIYARHGMDAERIYGVSVADMKTIAKTIKGQQALALDLYATGVMEAMYLAGMVASGAKMTRKDLDTWADGSADLQMIAEYTVPWVAIENAEGREGAVAWMQSPKERVATAGWCTYTGLLATRPDEALNLAEIESLLGAVGKDIAAAKNRVRHTMNGFVIAVGTYVKPLNAKAKQTARRIGAVEVDMGETACKVPYALACIEKAEAEGRLGRKKKTIRC